MNEMNIICDSALIENMIIDCLLENDHNVSSNLNCTAGEFDEYNEEKNCKSLMKFQIMFQY